MYCTAKSKCSFNPILYYHKMDYFKIYFLFFTDFLLYVLKSHNSHVIYQFHCQLEDSTFFPTMIIHNHNRIYHPLYLLCIPLCILLSLSPCNGFYVPLYSILFRIFSLLSIYLRILVVLIPKV